MESWLDRPSKGVAGWHERRIRRLLSGHGRNEVEGLGAIIMRDRLSQTSRRPLPPPHQFKTEFLFAIRNVTVVRIVQMFSNPDPTDRNLCAKAVIATVLKSWSDGLKTRYLITAGGFLSFAWPRQVTVADPSDPAPKDVQLLKEAAEKTCRLPKTKDRDNCSSNRQSDQTF
jgi:hypothetical protein